MFIFISNLPSSLFGLINIYIPLCLYLYIASKVFTSAIVKFTFHYVYIYINCANAFPVVAQVFTFHYVYIYIAFVYIFVIPTSTFTFHYVYIYIEFVQLYNSG